MASLAERLQAALREAGEEAKAEGRRFVEHPWDTTTNVAGRGLAGLAGLPVDTATNIANLGIAGYGAAKHALTGSTDLPDLLPEQHGGSEHIGRLMTDAGLMTGERNPLLEVAGGIVGPVAGAGVRAGAIGRAGRAGAEAGQAQAAARARDAALTKATKVPEIQGPPTLRQTIERNAREREPQGELPGLEQTLEQRSDNAELALNRVQAQARKEAQPIPEDEHRPTYSPPTPEVSPETQAALAKALRAEHQTAYDEAGARVDDLRRARPTRETLEDALPREEKLLAAKNTRADLVSGLDRPIEEFSDVISEPDAQQRHLNQLRDASREQAVMDEGRGYTSPPEWVDQLTTPPRYARDMPRGVPEPLDTGRSPGASERWWEQNAPRESIRDELTRQWNERDPQQSFPGLEKPVAERARRAQLASDTMASEEQAHLDDQTQTFNDPRGQDVLVTRAGQRYGSSPRYTAEADARLETAANLARQLQQDARRVGIEDLRNQPITAEEPWSAVREREGQIATLKRQYESSLPYNDRGRDAAWQARQAQDRRVHELQDADVWMDKQNPEPQTPAWAEELTTPPTRQKTLPRGVERPPASPIDRYMDQNEKLPAGRAWWWQHPETAPPGWPHSVEAFMRESATVPGILEYGPKPPRHVRSIQDFADYFSEQNEPKVVAKARREAQAKGLDEEATEDYVDDARERNRINAHVEESETGGSSDEDEYTYEPYTHDRGDSPVKDEYGDIKKVRTGELDAEGEPIKEKYVARGGEPVYDRYGNPEMNYDDPIENPNYDPPRTERELTLSRDGDEMTTTNWGHPSSSTTATGAGGGGGGGGSGGLFYQTQLGHATRAGETMGSEGGLTADNQIRLLVNALANDVRMGSNPRKLIGTGGGQFPHIRGTGTGPEIWRNLMGEAEHRLTSPEWTTGGRRAASNVEPVNPEAIQFTGHGFTANGEPITPQEIDKRLAEFSPGTVKAGAILKKDPHAYVTSPLVGSRTLMSRAVMDWAAGVTPEEAREAARRWPQISGGKPLFGVAATAGAAGLAKALRDDAQQKTD